MFNGLDGFLLPHFKLINGSLVFNRLSGYKLTVYNNMFNRVDLEHINKLYNWDNSLRLLFTETKVENVVVYRCIERSKKSSLHKLKLVTVYDNVSKNVYLIINLLENDYTTFNRSNLDDLLSKLPPQPLSVPITEQVLGILDFQLKGNSSKDGVCYFVHKSNELSLVLITSDSKLKVYKVLSERKKHLLPSSIQTKYKFLSVRVGVDLATNEVTIVVFNQFMSNDFLVVISRRVNRDLSGEEVKSLFKETEFSVKGNRENVYVKVQKLPHSDIVFGVF